MKIKWFENLGLGRIRQKQINDFLNNRREFDDNTPRYILENEECIKESIRRNIDSVRYAGEVSLEIQKYAIKKAIQNRYVLHENSPDFLKSNYDVVKNSINIDVSSADYVSWDALTSLNKPEEIEKIIDTLVKKSYELNCCSSPFLANNPRVVLGSIKKNVRTFDFASKDALSNIEVLKYLNSLRSFPIFKILEKLSFNQVRDPEALRICLEMIDAYVSNSKLTSVEEKLYKERVDSLFIDTLNIAPTTKTFKDVFQSMAEKKWGSYRREKANELENLFGKISAELRKNYDFKDALNELDFIRKMEEVLDDRYLDFYDAMEEYFNIYHSDAEDKIEKIQPAQNKISYYAALYVSKRKEGYIKKRVNVYNGWLKKFFTLRLDNPLVDKRIVQNAKKVKFVELYFKDDVEVCELIDSIVKKYSNELDEEFVLLLIQEFILMDCVKLEEIKPKPDKYDAYERYEKADKLIKRLNLGYISFSGPEVNSYLDIIDYDQKNGEYVYAGVAFSEDDLRQITEYQKLNKIFEEIKRTITLKIKKMDLNEVIDENEIKKLKEEAPFTDEYFEFDKSIFSNYTMNDLKLSFFTDSWVSNKFRSKCLLDDDSYELIKDILIKYGYLWLFILSKDDNHYDKLDDMITRVELWEIINNILSFSKLAKDLKLDLNTLGRIQLLARIVKAADLRTINILGLDIVEKLCKELVFTDGDSKKIVSRAERLVSKMAGRSMSTVPYVSGETMNYKYSLYDSQDVDVLLAGINTDACFRVCGNDNDFLHYCCLDKNGFVIKITDKDGNFVARAGGFRNGNCVFLNQLRTIYDENGNNYTGRYISETEEIIETLKKACEDIVSTSQKNELESKKINHVFITKSYSLDRYNSNVLSRIDGKIGDYPMDMDSQDWREFIDDNPGVLSRARYSEPFTTDYASNYSRICIATIKNPYDLEPDDLSFGDVPALYERTRNKIIATTNIDSNIIRKIKKIKGIDSYLKDKEYEEVMIPEGATVFVGDNWYCVYTAGEVVESCVLDCDEKAKREYELVHASLEKLTNEMIQQQIEEGQMVIDLQNNGDDPGYSLKKEFRESGE